VLIEKDGAERLYFVVETKSSLFTDDLRDKESAKIECDMQFKRIRQSQKRKSELR
jgi:type III restriction enzyme